MIIGPLRRGATFRPILLAGLTMTARSLNKSAFRVAPTIGGQVRLGRGGASSATAVSAAIFDDNGQAGNCTLSPLQTVALISDKLMNLLSK
jgi:hypothetical protein